MSVISAIVPRYVIAKSIKSLANPMDEFLQFKTEMMDSDDGASSSNGSTTVGRKRKLDHLTVEEKIQRKKLKNRVAAQTSRDRKKAKMEEMESKIATQAKEIRTLTDACKQLKKEKNDLEKVCKDLEARCENMERKFQEQEKLEANLTSRVIGSATKFNGSAVGIGSRVNRSRGKKQQQSQQRKPNQECIESNPSRLESNNPLHSIQDWIEGCDVTQLEQLADSLLGDLAAEIDKDNKSTTTTTTTGARLTEEECNIPRSTIDKISMGTTTDGSRITNSVDVKPKISTAFITQSPIDDDNICDSTFYPTCETTTLVNIKQDLDADDFQQEVEISDFEDDVLLEEDSVSSVISSIVNSDHSYNKPSPIFDSIICEEPLSPISSTLSSRSTPDVATIASDYGYESQNSPSSSSIEDIPLINLDEFPFWDDPISELFPSLA